MNDGTPKQSVTKLLERGLFYLDCGLRDDALRFLDEAASLDPQDLRVQQALMRARPAQAALAASTKTGRIHEIKPREAQQGAAPGSPQVATQNPMAQAFARAYRARDWQRAVEVARELIASKPNDARAWGSLAQAQRRLADFDGSLASSERTIALSDGDPGYVQAWAKTLWEAGRYAEAEVAYTNLMAELDEDSTMFADVRMSRGMVRMTLHGPAAGIDDYEWRWRAGEIALPKVTQPYWDGAPAPGKRILFFGEQGFGDAIQFARYIPLIAERCGRVIVPCKPAMKRLMQSLPGDLEICDDVISRDAFDLYVPAMSAMRLFEELPGDTPYLAAAEDDIARLRPQIRSGGLRVGIAWTGSPTNGGDWKRTIDPALFGGLARVPGVTLYSLQKVRDDTPENFQAPPEGAVDLASLLNDFADTAAAIACLDLVISADTSVVHLAGALGKPVWVMLPKVPDWRWMTERGDSPWYPTMRLYRQREFGDWPEVVARVAADLRSLVSGRDADAPAKERWRGLTRLLPWRR
ncbi:MAG: tetratricopeptide repeat-containing glycosyltransferase family protein [Rhodospirillales bacterium]